MNLLTTQMRHKDSENYQTHGSSLFQDIESEHYGIRPGSIDQKPLAFNIANNYNNFETFSKEKRGLDSLESSPSFAYKGKTQENNYSVKEPSHKSEVSYESGYSTRAVDEM